MVTYGTKLRAARALLGLTQENLAEKAALDRRDIIKFEQDVFLPSEQSKRAIRTALMIDLDSPEIEQAFSIIVDKANTPTAQMRASGAVALFPIGN